MPHAADLLSSRKNSHPARTAAAPAGLAWSAAREAVGRASGGFRPSGIPVMHCKKCKRRAAVGVALTGAACPLCHLLDGMPVALRSGMHDNHVMRSATGEET